MQTTSIAQRLSETIRSKVIRAGVPGIAADSLARSVPLSSAGGPGGACGWECERPRAVATASATRRGLALNVTVPDPNATASQDLVGVSVSRHVLRGRA